MALKAAFTGLCIVLCVTQESQALAAAVVPAVTYGAFTPGNIKGYILVLDIGSLSNDGNPHPSPGPSTVYGASECAGWCSKTAGCNAWTYCKDKANCGSLCNEYMKANPMMNATVPIVNGYASPYDLPPSWYNLTSIKFGGPWGYTGRCPYVCTWKGPGTKETCITPGTWPYGMCSLKKLANPAKPEYWSTNATEGWVSGYIVTPLQCAGISARACKRCLASKTPERCLACAKSAQLKTQLLDTLRGAGLDELTPSEHKSLEVT